MTSKPKSRPQSLSSYVLELVWTSCSLAMWRFSCSLNGHISPFNYVWLLSLEWLSQFEHAVLSLLDTCPFFWVTLNHIPLKGRFHNKKGNPIGLSTLTTILFLAFGAKDSWQPCELRVKTLGAPCSSQASCASSCDYGLAARWPHIKLVRISWDKLVINS